MEHNVEEALLMDCYGVLLTENQRRAMALRYNDDLSLSEIGETLGITRQGARDLLQRAEAALEDMEEKLGAARRGAALRGLLRDAQGARTQAELEAALCGMSAILEGNNGV